MPTLLQRRLPGFRFEAPLSSQSETLPRMDIAVFVGFAASGPLNTPVPVEDEAQFNDIFGPDAPLAWDAELGEPIFAHLAPAVRAFFRNGGRRCWVVRTAAAGHVNEFPVPNLVGVKLREDGTFGPADPAVARARSQGQWSDGLRVGTALQSQPVTVLSVSLQDRSALLVLRSSDEIVKGDLLRLQFRELGMVAMFPVETIDPPEESGSPPTPAVRVRAPAWWWSPETPDFSGSPPVDLSRPVGDKLNFEFWVRRDEESLVRLGGLGFAPGHPRFWNDLPSDEELYGSSAFDLSSNQNLPWQDWRVIVSPRFALAGSHDQNTYFFPVNMAPLPGQFAEPVKTAAHALERDGLGRFESDLFLDARLSGVGLQNLMGEADFIRYQTTNPPRLRGIHAALEVEEATIIAVPDAVHRGWTWEEPKPPEAQPSWPPERPHWWHHLVCDPPPDIPRTSHAARGNFLDCGLEEIAAPVLHLGDSEVAIVSATGTYTLNWSSSSTVVEFVLEEANHADFNDAVAIHSGAEATVQIFDRPPGEYFHRVRGVQGSNTSDWSNSVGVRVTTGELWRASPREAYADAALLEVHTALLRLCAARADMLAVLSLPDHYFDQAAMHHVAALKPARRLPAGLIPADHGAFVPPLSFGEEAALSYGALYHPWLLERTPDRDARRTPPDGAACGVLARRALERGAWIAPANELWRGAVALTPILLPESRLGLQEAQVNLVRLEPRGFLTLSADTLSPNEDLRPIHVRRLLILLRRLALKLGATYVFEPNDAAFRRLVQRSFEALLEDLFRRGAFAGKTAASSFQVVTGDGLNTPQSVELGRFIVELRVAPAQPLTFVTIRLLQTGHGNLAVAEV